MKSGYEISTDSGSDIVQLPTYIPAIQNAMNNLWSFSEFRSAPVKLSELFSINPSFFSTTLIPNLVSSRAIMAILSVSLYLACSTLKISIGFDVFKASIAIAGIRSGESLKSNLPPSSFSGDFIFIVFLSNVITTP